MGKKSSRKHQKVYRMKGCSKKTRKNYLGLGGSADINLAYTGNKVPTVPNPFLAYTGKGGAPATVMPVNTNGINKTMPSTGPSTIVPATPFLNPQVQRGGLGFMVGGKKHRAECKCSECKMRRHKQSGGNSGIPYPNGLVGSAWTSSTGGWPGVDGVQGGRNFLTPNTFPTDVQTSIVSTGANPPFSVGGKKTKKRGQRGGTLSNFMTQDLINLGRQFQFGLGSAYNALSGYSSPVNPMPWKGQIANLPSLSTIKATAI